MTATQHDEPTLRGLDLAVEVLAYNDLYPENWNQGDWLAPVELDTADHLPSGARKPDQLSWGEDERVTLPSGLRALTLDGIAHVTGHACGTTGCFAGNAVTLAGLEPTFPILSENGRVEWAAPAILFRGALEDVGSVAAWLLDIDTTQQLHHDDCDYWLDAAECDCSGGEHNLFDGSNDRDDIVAILAAAFRITSGDLEDRVAKRMPALKLEEDARREERKRKLAAKLGSMLGSRKLPLALDD